MQKLEQDNHVSQAWVTELSIPDSDISRWVDEGVFVGLTPNTTEGREGLAKEIGMIYSFVEPRITDESIEKVLKDERRGYRFMEELKADKITEETGMFPERVSELINFMVELGIIRGLKVWERRRRNNGYTEPIPPLLEELK